jgi:hypothetical protein
MVDNYLQLNENYKNESEFEVITAIRKYYELIIEYIVFAMENIKITNNQLLTFVISRGLETITHVFIRIIYFTKNINLAHHHSQKAYYFYIEFISQISDEEKLFLQLTSRDASIYVYKMTIFNEPKRQLVTISTEFNSKLDTLNRYIAIYQICFCKYMKYEVKLLKSIFKLISQSNITQLEDITWNEIITVDTIKKQLKNN